MGRERDAIARQQAGVLVGPIQGQCGTGLRPNRDITADWHELENPARLRRPGRQTSRADARGKPRFSTFEGGRGRETEGRSACGPRSRPPEAPTRRSPIPTITTKPRHATPSSTCCLTKLAGRSTSRQDRGIPGHRHAQQHGRGLRRLRALGRRRQAARPRRGQAHPARCPRRSAAGQALCRLPRKAVRPAAGHFLHQRL